MCKLFLAQITFTSNGTKVPSTLGIVADSLREAIQKATNIPGEGEDFIDFSIIEILPINEGIGVFDLESVFNVNGE